MDNKLKLSVINKLLPGIHYILENHL